MTKDKENKRVVLPQGASNEYSTTSWNFSNFQVKV